MPCVSALNRERLLPSTVFGPRLFRPLRRLASARFDEMSAVVESVVITASTFSETRGEVATSRVIRTRRVIARGPSYYIWYTRHRCR